MFNEDEIDVLCKSVTLNSQTSKKNKNRKNYKKNYYKKCLRKLNIMKMNKRMIITYTQNMLEHILDKYRFLIYVNMLDNFKK